MAPGRVRRARSRVGELPPPGPDQVLRDYLDAFRAANGRDFDGSMRVEGGWFVMRDDDGRVHSRKRQAEILATGRLRLAAERAGSGPARS